MNVSLPLRSIVPTVDAPVLAVLAGTTRPLTGRRVATLAGASHGAVNAVLARLVRAGIVDAEQQSNATLYVANRDHLAWPGVQILADLRRATLTLLREELRSWPIPPLTAITFGSFARQDGDDSSDIDILVVQDPTTQVGSNPQTGEQWLAQTEQLHARVKRATGNDCQVLDLTVERLADHLRIDDPLVQNWRSDGLHLAGQPLRAALVHAQTLVGAR